MMKATRLFAVFLLSLMAASGQVWAQQPRGEYYGPHMMWESGWMFFGPLIMVAFVAFIVAVVILLVRWLGDHRPGARTPPEGRSLEILKERFARGEIDKEEYEERRRTLRE
ncbi:MAG TPA: SHOCT domain-containing protein [Gammaproteobacteria bacterium]|nr:SHOCT domain-containing protein [Gammaproteobacteria bacterium]